ncbi:DUF2127 domain-containing protein [Nakamurella deserti]|uniref:DUF2127 domain-containing protein n=1 Tax=Nakamurella deserti TaxID=2164074 RepID=UPI000DBE32CF|nr:DUF2127 domain-containing protein [Nakamurella deserti]
MSPRWSAWELRACARHGHLTYRPDETELAARLSVSTAVGEAWRCLRCGDFAVGPPRSSGPAEDAPLVLRGAALRQAVVIRFLAVERDFRFVLLGLGVWGVLQFRDSRQSIQATVDRDLPLLSAMGIHVEQLALVRDLQNALTESPGRLTLVAVGLAAYALLELAEAVGLWTMKRWGEYLAVVATSVFLPWEIRELARGLTAFHIGLFVVNLAAVGYLLWSKRLFGLRGGRAAYDAGRRGEQLLEVEAGAVRGAPVGRAPRPQADAAR